MSSFRTRLAPSPTGYLHFGTARQALFTKLFALKNQGIWYLRLEDTDRQRLQLETVGKMLNNLAYLGLVPDEGVVATNPNDPTSVYKVISKGDFGPYIQSERLSIYYKYIPDLLDRQLAYWCYLNETERQELQELKTANRQPINYFSANVDRFGLEKIHASLETVQSLASDQPTPVLRYRLQREATIDCPDELLGTTSFDLNLEEDFVLLKSDGYPTYHFAHLIDDYLMETSLVLRAQEWYPSLAKHVTMFQDVFGKVPKYLHLPFILSATGHKKMSKRDDNVDIENYFLQGFLPEAIVNYLAFLGWNPGTEQELYLSDEDFIHLNQTERLAKLIQNISVDFSLETISKSPARFNLEKLTWFNREFIKKMTLTEFVEKCAGYSQTAQWIRLVEDKALLYLALWLDKNRVNVMSEVGQDSACIMEYTKPAQSTLVWKNITEATAIHNLLQIYKEIILPIYETEAGTLVLELQQKLRNLVIKNVSNQAINMVWTELTSLWEKVLKDWLTFYKHPAGEYLWPLRVALSGLTRSPSPFELLAILSPAEVKNRLDSLCFEVV